ncbi:TPA: fimbrial protein [Escherichia coli]|nr:fimbrial protein [Escherichia coli]
MKNIKKNIYITKLSALCLVGLLFVSTYVIAADVPIEITGEILTPPCQINHGKTIEVSFGDIPLTDISNHQNWRKISVPVNCEYAKGTAYVKIIGYQMKNKKNVLLTNVENFGIALYQGDGDTVELILGDGKSREDGSIGYPVQSGLLGKENGTFTFTAIPFKETGKSVSAGKFTASANIGITYD